MSLPAQSESDHLVVVQKDDHDKNPKQLAEDTKRDEAAAALAYATLNDPTQPPPPFAPERHAAYLKRVAADAGALELRPAANAAGMNASACTEADEKAPGIFDLRASRTIRKQLD